MGASDTEIMLEIVGALHAGVADEEEWARGLDRVGEVLRVPSILFGSAAFPSQTFRISGHRTPQEAVDMIAGPLANPASNPYIAALPRLPLRRPVLPEDIGGQSALIESDLWREIMQPFNWPWTMGTVLERQPERTDFMMLSHPADIGDFTDTEISRFGLLIPHIARAARVRREIEASRALAADFMAVLDKLDRGVVLVGDKGQVRFANRAAEDIFREDDGLDATQAGLLASDPRDNRAIRSIVHGANQTGLGRASVAVDACAVGRPSGRAAYSVVAEPLAPAHGETIGAPRGAGAVLFIGDAERSGGPTAVRISVVYGLTAAESEVAAAVARGAATSDVAARHGVAEDTVRKQLKAIYLKVGVSRQSQLAARIAADLGGLL